MTRIDIIIPVYRGVAQTRACIESVLAAKNQHASEIVVMNDASPESEIAAYLADLAVHGRITLVTNPVNLGFVATCNIAMQMHTDRDVVLLNSDTVVPDRWLDRMIACANSAPKIASVTPFSNNATLCSYPRIAVSNELPAGVSLQELDAIFASVNAGQYVEIPTGVGFCMLMTRAAIDAVGLFDDVAFGRGYGEENDWCMRAGTKGYSHRLCGDLFIYHQGEVSFGDKAINRKFNAQSVIDARYPGYREYIAQHLATDPARPLRRCVDLVRLTVSLRPRIVFIVPNLGAEIERHVGDLATVLARSVEVLILRPHGDNYLSLSWVGNSEELTCYFAVDDDSLLLINFLSSIGISRIHLHHVHGLPVSVLNLHHELGVPLDITLHDFFPISRRHTLGPGGAHDRGDTSQSNIDESPDIEWRRRIGSLLRAAARIIAPSSYLAQQIKIYYPDVNIQIHAHPEVFAASPSFPWKVLILGELTIEKGLRIVEACARDARARDLPLSFKLLGHTSEPVATIPELPFVVGGSIDPQNLELLISLERPDAFMFPAQIPETYSSMLTASLRAGRPVIASRLGAYIERLEGVTIATTVPWDASAAEWNDAMIAAVNRDQSIRTYPLGATKLGANVEAFCDWYVASIGGPRESANGPLHLESQSWYPPDDPRPGDMHSIYELFEDGVQCGNAASLLELKTRVMSVDERISSADQEISDASKKIESMHLDLENLQTRLMEALEVQKVRERERDAARAAFESVTSSTSWRATEPLRKVLEWIRAWRA